MERPCPGRFGFALPMSDELAHPRQSGALNIERRKVLEALVEQQRQSTLLQAFPGLAPQRLRTLRILGSHALRHVLSKVMTGHEPLDVLWPQSNEVQHTPIGQ